MSIWQKKVFVRSQVVTVFKGLLQELINIIVIDIIYIIDSIYIIYSSWYYNYQCQ